MTRKARILVISLSVVLLAVLVFIPKVIGLGIRDITITNLVAMVPAEANGQLAIDETRFQSGWFESNATLSTDYRPFGTDLITVDFDFKIQHGPLLFTNQGPRFGVAYAQITPRTGDGIPIFESNSSVPFPETLIELFAGFDQSLLISLKIEPIGFSENGTSLAFDGLEASLTTQADQSAEVLVNVGRLELNESQSQQNLTVAGITLTSNSTKVNDILAPTTATFSVANISSTAPIDINITNLTASSEISDSDSETAIQMFQRITVDEISGDVPLKSFDWSLEVDQVQRQLIAKYYTLLTDLQTQSANDPQAAAQRINQISQELTLLIANNPLIVNNLVNADLYGGTHRVEININWDGLPQLRNIARLNLNEAIDALSLELDVSLDLEAMLRSPAAESIDPYIQQGYLAIDNGRILVQATLENSQLTLNGEPIALDQFF